MYTLVPPRFSFALTTIRSPCAFRWCVSLDLFLFACISIVASFIFKLPGQIKWTAFFRLLRSAQCLIRPQWDQRAIFSYQFWKLILEFIVSSHHAARGQLHLNWPTSANVTFYIHARIWRRSFVMRAFVPSAFVGSNLNFVLIATVGAGDFRAARSIKPTK